MCKVSVSWAGDQMDSQGRVLSISAKFIRVGACLQFVLLAIGLAPPLGRWIMRLIHEIDSVEMREALSYVVFFWIVGAPIVATIAYTRLTSEEKTGTEGILLLFWWISLVVMFAVALSFGAAF
jgi:hypothetical protein